MSKDEEKLMGELLELAKVEKSFAELYKLEESGARTEDKVVVIEKLKKKCWKCDECAAVLEEIKVSGATDYSDVEKGVSVLKTIKECGGKIEQDCAALEAHKENSAKPE